LIFLEIAQFYGPDALPGANQQKNTRLYLCCAFLHPLYDFWRWREEASLPFAPAHRIL